MASTYIEPIPDPFEGEYKNLVVKLMGNTWLAIVYIAASILVIYGFGFITNPLMLYMAIQLPLVLACSYVVSPNKNVSRRLPVYWIGTAIFASLIYASQNAVNYSDKIIIGNFLGVLAWAFAIYWTISAIKWSSRARQYNKEKLKRAELIEFIAKIISIWGATLQLAFFLSWLIVPYLELHSFNAPYANAFISTVKFIKKSSIFSYLPLGLLFFGLLIIVSFKFKDDPYVPKSMEEVLAFEKRSIFTNFLLAIRLPIWIMLVIIGFIIHFLKLLWLSTKQFGDFYIARLVFIVIGLVFAPVILFWGHSIFLNALKHVSTYSNFNYSSFFNGFKYFIIINVLVIVSLCLYVISIPPLAARYRGQNLASLISSIKDELFIYGKSASNAVGHTFSLFGIIILLIPITDLLPGGPDFGIFSTLYSAIILTCLAIYLINTYRKPKDDSSV